MEKHKSRDLKDCITYSKIHDKLFFEDPLIYINSGEKKDNDSLLCRNIMISFNHLFGMSIITLHYDKDFKELIDPFEIDFESITGTDITKWNSFNTKIESIKNNQCIEHLQVNITNLEDVEHSSFINLLNEACVCLKNNCLYAFASVCRAMIFEIGKFYELDSKLQDKDFYKMLNLIKSNKIMLSDEGDYWKSLIEKCGNVIHYHSDVGQDLIRFCCKGIKYLFDHLNKFVILKENLPV